MRRFVSYLIALALAMPSVGLPVAAAAELALPPALSVESTASSDASSVAAFEKIGESVVAIAAGPERVGSGVVVGPNLVLTSLNVVKTNMPLSVMGTGDIVPFKVVATDKTLKIALLSANLPGVKPIGLVDSRELKAGDVVAALGIPGATREVARIDGKVKSPSIASNFKLLYTDIPIEPLVEGGPLVTPKGKIVGVIVSQSFGQQAGKVGVAVTSEAAKALIEDIENADAEARAAEIAAFRAKWISRGVLAVILVLMFWGFWSFGKWYRRMEEREAAEAEAHAAVNDKVRGLADEGAS